MDEETRTRHVLVVDDDEPIRESLRFALEEEGYGVIEAPDGVVALDTLRAMPHPAVVLTNHNMPRLDGPGLFDIVLNEPDLVSRHRFIYMTAADRVLTPTFRRHLEELAVPVIRKPFDIEHLLSLVAEQTSKLRDADAETCET